MQQWIADYQRKLESSDEIFGRIKSATIKQEADAVIEDMAAAYLAESPQVPIDRWRRASLEHVGYMTGMMDRPEANRILYLFQTEHPFRDREGNRLPFRQKPGKSLHSRSTKVFDELIHACKTKDQARALVQEEAANQAYDDPSAKPLDEARWRKLVLQTIWYGFRFMDDSAEVARLSELFDL